MLTGKQDVTKALEAFHIERKPVAEPSRTIAHRGDLDPAEAEPLLRADPDAKAPAKRGRGTRKGAKDAEGNARVPGIFAAVPYCLDLIGGPYVETREAVIKAFRPKSALRPPAK